MVDVLMQVVSVGVGGGRAVVQLQAVVDPNDELAAGGSASVVINDPDALEEFEDAGVYSVSFSKASAPAGTAAAAKVDTESMRVAAAAIPNSTNTANYKTPPELKVVPPSVPDGVVTLPRPAVIMEPVTATPADAGVVTAPPQNPQAGSQPEGSHTHASPPPPAGTPPAKK